MNVGGVGVTKAVLVVKILFVSLWIGAFIRLNLIDVFSSEKMSDRAMKIRCLWLVDVSMVRRLRSTIFFW